MCEVSVEGFTLTDLPRDPLIRMMMTADGVSEKDFSELLLRVKGTLYRRAMAGDNIHDRRPSI